MFRNAVALALGLTLAAAGCNRGEDSPDTGGAGVDQPIGVDLPRADSDFWNSYAKYIPQYARESGIT